MPLLATLIGAFASGLAALLSRFVAFDLALKFAAYGAWIAVTAAFLSAVFACISSLYTGLTAMFGASGGVNGGLVAALAMGVGMLIPANAGGVLGCVASVWIATSIYKIQTHGISNYSK